MAASQNGWRANDPSTVSRRLVPGTKVGLTLRNGPPGDLLLEVAARFDREVQDIDNARGALDDWGYAERPIRGGTELSNHASGTAEDLNATRWPLGQPARVNLNPAQIVRVGRIVAACRGVVVWGAVWKRPDPMHFELAEGTDVDDCERALAHLRATDTAGPTIRPRHQTIQLGDVGPDVALIQRFLGITEVGFGPSTQAAVIRYQRMRNLVPDAVVGPLTWAQTGL